MKEINERGRLTVGKAEASQLAKEFKTPLYAYDEDRIRAMCAIYRDTLRREYGNAQVLYASKAFSCKAMYQLVKEEGLGIDVVSKGELYTAVAAGFLPENAYMHGNNKLPDELEYALDVGIGCVVVDSYAEADLLNALLEGRNRRQKVLIRINPGVEAHTHEFVQTATPDSKFGFSVANGEAMRVADYVLSKENLDLYGFHCHIGSQIFEAESFCVAVEKCVRFLRDCKNALGFETRELNMGGGFGIWYTDEDRALTFGDYQNQLKMLSDTVKSACAANGLVLPRLVVEPGRSIVGEAGTTLYTVGNIKEIPNIKKYLAVDGGMFEAPRYALYGAKYTCILADRATEAATETVTVAGKCCESGDMVAADVKLPKASSGEILAVLSTGAYHYSMASNYNRNLIPAVVFVRDGKARLVVKRQTVEDLLRNDLPL